MKRLLMVAFHFPPAAVSSGIQRTLRFVQNLPSLGWEPVVVTAQARAHERTNDALVADIPAGVRVVPTFALDAARHLSFAGRYPSFLARPDRWRSWHAGAVRAALKLAREQRFDGLWSTYPIATAHAVAADVHAATGLPWIADFRDPMAQDGYPSDPKTWAAFKSIEERAVRDSAALVFTTSGAARMYRERYPALPEQRIVVIENGYDEETFAASESMSENYRPSQPHRTTLLHSGVVYPSERDPSQLVEALGLLKASRVIGSENFAMRFRASGHDDLIARLAHTHDVEDLIELAPSLPYREALSEMLGADGLVVLQARNCNAQIPAKLYEYLRARRPILAFTDPAGDTARVLLRSGIADVAQLDSACDIARLLERFLCDASGRRPWIASDEAVRCSSRQRRSEELAELLQRVCGAAQPGSS